MASNPACFETPVVIDAAADDLVEAIVRTSHLEPARFRAFSYVNRPEPAATPQTVAFHYMRFGIGGAERVTAILMRLLHEHGMNVILYTDMPPEEGDYDLPAGVVRKTVPAVDERERIAFWLTEIREQGIDAVVYNSWLLWCAPVDCMAIQSAGASFIYHTHGVSTCFIGSPWGEGWLQSIQKAAYMADAIVPLSAMDELFWKAYSNNVVAVPNPVDLYMRDVELRPELPKGQTIVFCARLNMVEKRPDLALEIFTRVASQLPEARLRFVGGGDPKDEQALADRARELGIADKVDFLGFQNDAVPFMNEGNLLLMTSPNEGFPLALTEAACLGLPAVIFELPHITIAADNPGIVQVPQGDVEAAARAAVRILSDRSLQESLSCATREAYLDACRVDFAELWDSIMRLSAAARLAPTQRPRPWDTPQIALVHNVVAASQRAFALDRQRTSRIEELEGRLASQSEELRCITSSASFRLGRALTGIPRKIRDVLLRRKDG